MSRILMLAAAAEPTEPLVSDALARVAEAFPDETVDVVLIATAAAANSEGGQVRHWPLGVRLHKVPPARGVLATVRHIAAINLNSRRRARAATRSKLVRDLARQADVIISLSAPTDRAALRLGARLPIPLMAGLNAATAARRRGEW